MQALPVRQLKNNPSSVLRAAEEDAMALVTSHQQPAALMVALDRIGLPDPAAVRSGLALSLFQAGSLSVASAARLAGLPLLKELSEGLAQGWLAINGAADGERHRLGAAAAGCGG